MLGVSPVFDNFIKCQNTHSEMLCRMNIFSLGESHFLSLIFCKSPFYKMVLKKLKKEIINVMQQSANGASECPYEY